MDNARVFMFPVRPGWRWQDGGLWYMKEWEEQDKLLSPTEVTKRMVFDSMQGLTEGLSFTVETHEEFADGWLPTLGFKLRMGRNNIIEKPTTSNRTLQSDTALNHNCLIKSLANEVERRLDSFSETVLMRERTSALNRFSQKLLNSGHSLATVRSVMVSGIKGYKRRVARCKAAGTPMHRSATESATTRRTKKLLAKTNWFRQSEDTEGAQGDSERFREESSQEERSGHGADRVDKEKSSKERAKPGEQPIRTTSVLFVEFSKGGGIQKSMRDVVDRLKPMLGFNIRVTEKGGTQLGQLLSNKNLWSGQPCGRANCRPCQQKDAKKEPCTMRNIVYESECGKCNPEGSRKSSDKEDLQERRDVASLYVGESGRSLHERAGEHWRDAELMKEESHMREHLQEAHRGEENPDFRFKVVRKCKTSLERQVREAVRIQLRGNVLNKKGTYNRCKLTRMVIDEEWDKKVWEEAWEQRGEEDEIGETLTETTKSKRKESEEGSRKRAKMESDEGLVWGEYREDPRVARSSFMTKGEE